MTNPFDDENGQYLVLANADGRFSLWPAPLDPPAGWTVAVAAADRAKCLAYIEAHWISLVTSA